MCVCYDFERSMQLKSNEKKKVLITKSAVTIKTQTAKTAPSRSAVGTVCVKYVNTDFYRLGNRSRNTNVDLT